MHLIVRIQQLAIQRCVTVAPTCDARQGVRVIHVAATGIAMLEELSRNTSALARREVVEPIKRDDIVAFQQIELGPKRAGICDLIDVELGCTEYGPQAARIVTHAVPW